MADGGENQVSVQDLKTHLSSWLTLKGLSLLKLMPRNKLCKQHPAVVRVKCAAKRHVKFLD